MSKKPEIFFRNAGDFFEYIILRIVIQVRQGQVLISIGHEETGNGPGETTEMVADFIFVVLLLLFLLFLLFTIVHQSIGLAFT